MGWWGEFQKPGAPTDPWPGGKGLGDSQGKSVGGNANWQGHYGKQYGRSSENQK